ncbi:MAG: 4Fe-4S dicluster domain-containing protein [Spirochaetaceae bacterium]|jgi:electron transport complex protein RnfC|nr:4Fe-4S dicluster domain-containing protein [Spirochaetaceae bacterium]
MRVHSFSRGGIHFADSTVPPRDSSITAFLPGLSVIPLVQHTGSKANPVVSVGSRVSEGMLIGRGQGLGSANIHATVPGRVVRTVSWKMAEGITNDALVIKLEGSFEKLGRREEIFPWQGLPAFELQRIIAEYGIVEMEGSGRPVSDMLYALRSSRTPVTLVVRCVFDDPWLAADYVLLRERLEAVAEGSRIAARAGRMDRIVLVFSRDEKDLGRLLMDAMTKAELPVSLALVGARYPQRNRRELELVLERFAQEEGIELGTILALGPATLAAIHDAVKLKKTILDRYVAVGGSAIKKPQVMKVRIGTRIGEIFAECGGFIDTPRRIGSGSPLLGRTVVDLDEPVIKTSFAIFAILPGQIGGSVRSKCIGCGECRIVCPLGLDPEALYKYMNGSDHRDVHFGRAAECHGCGCCEAVCPSRLPLSTTIIRSALKGN